MSGRKRGEIAQLVDNLATKRIGSKGKVHVVIYSKRSLYLSNIRNAIRRHGDNSWIEYSYEYPNFILTKVAKPKRV